MPETFAYETRLVLFLDLLGFREIVCRTTQEPAYLTKVIRALDRVGEMADDPRLQRSCVVTQFSDSIVVSYRINEESGVFHLLTKIALCVVDLVSYGFLVRGAVTIGKLFHDDQRLVGPAIVRAYDMESKKANYPRVIVDPDVFSIARQYRSDIHDPDEEEKYVRDYLTKDEDGWHYYQYVSWHSVVNVTGGENDLYADYLRRLAQIIEAGLRHSCAGVRRKHLWLHKQYTAAIAWIAKLPPNHGYRMENPELCAAIEGLPTLVEEAARAGRRRV